MCTQSLHHLFTLVAKSLGNALETPGDPWRSLEIPGDPWSPLEIPGDPWSPLEIPGDPWRPLEIPGVTLCGSHHDGSLARRVVQRFTGRDEVYT
jgi:hypothetical protein